LRPGADHRRGANPATALTDCAVSAVPFSRVLGFFEKYPRLAATIFWSFSCEAAMYAVHPIDVGRRSALERVAHFLLELLSRLQASGLADEFSFQMRLTQELIGDALGLSVPHVSRTLRQRREDDLVGVEGKERSSRISRPSAHWPILKAPTSAGFSWTSFSPRAERTLGPIGPSDFLGGCPFDLD
jgi:hypothetical protein